MIGFRKVRGAVCDRRASGFWMGWLLAAHPLPEDAPMPARPQHNVGIWFVEEMWYSKQDRILITRPGNK